MPSKRNRQFLRPRLQTRCWASVERTRVVQGRAPLVRLPPLVKGAAAAWQKASRTDHDVKNMCMMQEEGVLLPHFSILHLLGLATCTPTITSVRQQGDRIRESGNSTQRIFSTTHAPKPHPSCARNRTHDAGVVASTQMARSCVCLAPHVTRHTSHVTRVHKSHVTCACWAPRSHHGSGSETV